MATLNKSKVTVINRGFTIIFIIICFLLSIIQSQEAYAEMKKVSGTSKHVNRLIAYETYYPQTKVRFRNNLQMFSSADPDWDKAKIFTVFYYINPITVYYHINPTGEGDDYKGCAAITYANGDQAFIMYDGSWKWVLPRDGFRWTSETKGIFTGGTGKFEGIKGTFTSKGKGVGRSNTTGEWEIEYEIASTRN